MKLSVILIFVLMLAGTAMVVMAGMIKKLREKLRKTEKELKKEREWKEKAERTVRKMVEISDKEKKDVKEIINSSNGDVINELNNFLQK